MQFLSRSLVLPLFLALLADLAPAQTLRLVKMADGLDTPTDAVSPPGDDRIFVTSSRGKIWIVEDGVRLPQPFLDITPLVWQPHGLTSIAFHPDYGKNGRFFVTYLDPDIEAWLVEYQVSADPNVADAASATTLIGPYQQIGTAHNWNCLRFGPDGMLYLATGDGGATHIENQAQNLGSLNGKILRLDVDLPAPYVPADNPFVGVPGARGEIWMYGLRQPWRISFDSATGDLFIVDVGGNDFEEVNFVAAGKQGGQNFGWRCMEGPNCTNFEPTCGCNLPEYRPPLYVFPHEQGQCSVIGGEVYRGAAMPALVGAFLFADHCTGRVWALRDAHTGTPQLVEHTTELSPDGGVNLDVITSINVGPDGELLVLDRLEGGRLLRIAPVPVDSYCKALPNTAGQAAEMAVSGSYSVVTNDLALAVVGAVPNSFGLFFYGDERVSMPFGEGVRCVGGLTQRIRPVQQVDATGAANRAYDVSASPIAATVIEPGSTWNFQFWYRDGQTPTGFNTSDAVTITFLP